jgi:predicted RNase H-like nuclease (RuvC/YqgF family)
MAAVQPETAVAAAAGKDSAAISRAMDEVRQIVQSLEQALEQMEEVLELVELADRQKYADEREIESLRRALRRIQQPRGHKETPREHGRD